MVSCKRSLHLFCDTTKKKTIQPCDLCLFATMKFITNCFGTFIERTRLQTGIMPRTSIMWKSDGVTFVTWMKERMTDDKEPFSQSKSYIKDLMQDNLYLILIRRFFKDNIRLTTLKSKFLFYADFFAFVAVLLPQKKPCRYSRQSKREPVPGFWLLMKPLQQWVKMELI